MRTIAIINQKGGCGKTTTAINLSAHLARRGMRTLLVDMDPQSHCAAGLGIPESRIEFDVSDALSAPDTRPIDPDRLIWRAGKNLDLIPSRMRLAGLEAPRGGLADRADKERRLSRELARHAAMYDLCVIDCSPSIGLLAYNALSAADTVIIPVETSFFSLQGATKQFNTVKTMSRRLGVNHAVRLVATMHDEQSAVAIDLLEELRRRFGARLSPVVVRRDSKLKEAASFGQHIFEHAPTCLGAGDYAALADWLTRELRSDKSGLTGDLDAPLDESSGDPPAITVSPAPLGGVADRVLRGDTAPAGPTIEPKADVAARVMSRIEEVARRAAALQKSGEPPLGAGIARAVLDRSAHTTLVLSTVEPKAIAPPESVRALFGARTTSQGVLFVQPLSLGQRVAVAGDFNAWSPSSHTMVRNESLGVFELLIQLPAGRHAYRLVVDGVWSEDQHNARTEVNPFGGHNAVVEVQGTYAPATT